ncbi:MAG: Hsp20/alpha crystallin family protein [Methanobacterium sp.]
MVEKEIKEEKEAVKEEAGEVKETTAEKTEDAQELAASGRSQAENILNNIFNSFRSTQEDVSKAISDYTMSMEKPLADVIETEDEIIVKTDLPGIKKEDVDVRLTEDSVEITATFEEESDEEDVNYIRKERNYGESQRFIQLPTKVKVKDAVAKFENSVLTITLPKLEGEKFKVSIK